MADPEEQPPSRWSPSAPWPLVPACDFSSVSLRRRRGRVETTGSTSELASRCDALQYELEEGPCLDAVWDGDSYLAMDVASDTRWPRWGPQVAELGVGSILAMRLASGQENIGALNLYATSPLAFGPEDVDIALVYTIHAANALTSARLASGLQSAVHSRHLIGVAQGILMGTHQLTHGAVLRAAPQPLQPGEPQAPRPGPGRGGETTQVTEQGMGARLFGYTKLYGAVPGGQAEYLRVPHADFGPVKVPEGPADDRYLFLSDVLPTGWQAVEYAGVEAPQTLLVLGAGPIGDMATRIALHRGVRVINAESVPERLERVRAAGAETIDLDAIDDDLGDVVREMTQGRGADAVIDAVGMEAHGSPATSTVQKLVQVVDQGGLPEVGPPEAARRLGRADALSGSAGQQGDLVPAPRRDRPAAVQHGGAELRPGLPAPRPPPRRGRAARLAVVVATYTGHISFSTIPSVRRRPVAERRQQQPHVVEGDAELLEHPAAYGVLHRLAGSRVAAAAVGPLPRERRLVQGAAGDEHVALAVEDVAGERQVQRASPGGARRACPWCRRRARPRRGGRRSRRWAWLSRGGSDRAGELVDGRGEDPREPGGRRDDPAAQRCGGGRAQQRVGEQLVLAAEAPGLGLVARRVARGQGRDGRPGLGQPERDALAGERVDVPAGVADQQHPPGHPAAARAGATVPRPAPATAPP